MTTTMVQAMATALTIAILLTSTKWSAELCEDILAKGKKK